MYQDTEPLKQTTISNHAFDSSNARHCSGHSRVQALLLLRDTFQPLILLNSSLIPIMFFLKKQKMLYVFKFYASEIKSFAIAFSSTLKMI